MNHVRNKSLILRKKNIFIHKFSNVMRRILIILLLCLIFLPSFTFAQTKTPAQAIPTSDEIEKISDKVDELKDKVASRVAQLKLVEKRGIVGKVESVTDIQITLADLNGKTRIIDVDELTKFSSENNSSFGISDVKKGSVISVLGLYNKESQRLLARFLNEIEIPLILVGVVSKKDDKNFTITLSTEDGTNYLVDIERITKTYEYDEGQLAQSGFSKIEVLENAVVLGFADPKEKNRLTGSRIITFPKLPSNPRIPIIEEDTRSSPTPAKKVQTEE